MRFTLPDMSCGHCRGTVERAIADADPRAETEFDMAARSVEVRSDRSEADLTAVLSAAGYPPAQTK